MLNLLLFAHLVPGSGYIVCRGLNLTIFEHFDAATLRAHAALDVDAGLGHELPPDEFSTSLNGKLVVHRSGFAKSKDAVHRQRDIIISCCNGAAPLSLCSSFTPLEFLFEMSHAHFITFVLSVLFASFNDAFSTTVFRFRNCTWI